MAKPQININSLLFVMTKKKKLGFSTYAIQHC